MLIIITGCLGFMASHFTRKCLEKGWNVFGIDKCTYVANLDCLEEFRMWENFTWKPGDIKDISWLPNCDYLINFAAESHVENSIIDSKAFLDTNVLGIVNLLNLIRSRAENSLEFPVFFHISTDEVYGDIEKGSFKETQLLMPSNPYSASKAAGDLLVLAWARTYKLPYLILRPTNNYGEYQYPEKLLPFTVKRLQRNLKIPLHDNGEPIRTWLHAEDTADAILLLIEKRILNEIFNISGGFEQSNKETVRQIIHSFYGTDTKWEEYINWSFTRKGQDTRYSIDDSKLKTLGWKPKHRLPDDIPFLVSFYKKHFRW